MYNQAAEDGNPRKMEIEAYWDRIYQCLSNNNGTQARDIMQELRDSDSKLFNATYWKVNKWMGSVLAFRAASDSEAATLVTKEEIGRARLVAFVHDVARSPQWQTNDLPAMVSKLRGWVG